MLSMLGKNSGRWHLEIFFLIFFQKIEFNISCKLSPQETICMKCKTLVFGKLRKIITYLLSAEFECYMLILFVDFPEIAGNQTCLWYIIGSHHEKRSLRAYADSEGPDQPAQPQPHSLIRTISVYLQNHWILQNVWIESKGTHDILCMCRMMWFCLFCTCLNALFLFDAACMI